MIRDFIIHLNLIKQYTNIVCTPFCYHGLANSTHFCDDTVTKEEEVLVPREDLTVPCEALERYKESGFLLDEDKMKGVDRGEPTAPCYVYK